MKVRTQEAEDDYYRFRMLEREFGECQCWRCPPCSWCTHPGNPLNQENDPDAWIEVPYYAPQDRVETHYQPEAEGSDEADPPQNYAIAPIRPGEEL